MGKPGTGAWHIQRTAEALHWRVQAVKDGGRPCHQCGKAMFPTKWHTKKKYESVRYCCRSCASKGAIATRRAKKGIGIAKTRLNGLEQWGGGTMEMPKVNNRETYY